MEGSGPTTQGHIFPDLTALSVASYGTKAETVYTYQIRAVNESGTGGAEAAGTESDSSQANPGIPLHAPTGVTVSYSPASTTFTISWDAHSETSADFEVRGTGPVGVVLSMTAVAGATSSTIQSDRFGQFEFEVRARNNFGPWSESVTVEATASPFTEASMTREADENAPASSNVGQPVVVAATGYDNVTYSLSGSAGFVINSATGQITVVGDGAGPGTYPVKVTASLTKVRATSDSAVNVIITVTSVGPLFQLAKLAPIGGDEDNAGNAVAVDDESRVIVVGAKGANRVYLYDRIRDYTPAILEASDSPTEFGLTVAVDGDTVVVGSKSNQVYVFTKPEDGWPDDSTAINETAILTDSDTATGDGFGESVAISGNTIVVGAAMRDDTTTTPTTSDVGEAYVYVRPATGFWATTSAETATLKAPTATRAASDQFGGSVAIDVDNVVVGASGAEKAYLFVTPVGGWTGAPEPKVTMEGYEAEDGDDFGWSVDIDEFTIVVGEPQATGGPGAVHVFDINGAQTEKLQGLGADPGNRFGYSVAVSGEYIVVSSGSQSDNDNAGSVQVFRGSDCDGTPCVLLASDGEAGDLFGLPLDGTGAEWSGSPIAIDGGLMVVGASSYDHQQGNDRGAAYVFGRLHRVSTRGS